jgi:hypothetical protein
MPIGTALRTYNQHAFILKIDFAKAFGRLEWHFITNALCRLGLNQDGNGYIPDG